MSMYMFMLIFAISLFASARLTPIVRKMALRLGIVDHPNSRKIHLLPMPLLGGLAIYAAVALTLPLFIDNSFQKEALGILGGATLLLLAGVLDDLGLIHHQLKLMVAMPLAAIILIVSGVRGDFSPLVLILPSSSGFYPIDAYALTVIWIVGVTAAFSILDNMDGLCAGVAAIASAFFLLFALRHGQELVGILSAALIGASLGFLYWNFNPAKIFMGGGGAMFLGFMMAALGLKLRPIEVPQSVSWMIPIFILSVPIFDTSLVSISRLRRGLIPFTTPGKDHTSHRLSNVGLGHRNAVLVLYGVGGLGGILALLVSLLPVGQSYVLAASVVFIVLLTIIALEHTPYERQKRLKKRGFSHLRVMSSNTSQANPKSLS